MASDSLQKNKLGRDPLLSLSVRCGAPLLLVKACVGVTQCSEPAHQRVGCLLHQLGLVFPDLVLFVLPSVICHFDIPQYRVVADELQHQLLIGEAEVAGFFLGPFLLLQLLPILISKAG